MVPFYPMINPVQPYEWGSRTAIPDILGLTAPAETPMAELWMGTHPKAPSTVETPDGPVSLIDLIGKAPADCLGEDAVHRLGNELPFLFKILAAAAPLSIQAHPNGLQAKEGFARENEIGVPLTAAERNYRDPNHKPECICAVTPFWAMRGFRPLSDSCDHFIRYCPRNGTRIVDVLRNQGTSDPIRDMFVTLMYLSGSEKKSIIEESIAAASDSVEDDPISMWILRFAEAYPGDIGIISPLYLNTVMLKPGEAMFLPSGELHAYLDGVGIEIMANSDNVLRGGLTPKFMAVEELIQVLTFQAGRPAMITPDAISPTETVYRTPADEFELSVIQPQKSSPHRAPSRRSGEILLVFDGEVEARSENTDGNIRLKGGQSVFIPSATGAYTVYGNGTIYKAAIPALSQRQQTSW